MKAAVFLGPERIEIKEVATPSPGEGEVLLKVHACAICGTDVRIYYHGQKNVQPPHITGHEVVGEVVELGRGVKGYEKGERVTVVTEIGCGNCDFCLQGKYNLCPQMRAVGYYFQGGFAEYMVVPREAVKQGNILPIPDELSSEEGTLAEPLSCVINGQEYLNINYQDTVVIFGAGPIGCMHAELARVSGAKKVIMVDISPQRLKMGEKFRVDLLLNPEEENTVERIMEETGGKGADVVITACPSGKAQEDAVKITATCGRISFFGGLPHQNPCIQLNSNLIHYKEISIFGAFSSYIWHYKKAISLLASGQIEGGKFITLTLPLEKLVEGIQQVKEGKELKVVITTVG